jgi:hypothetical protein
VGGALLHHEQRLLEVADESLLGELDLTGEEASSTARCCSTVASPAGAVRKSCMRTIRMRSLTLRS